jgi:hypothetical protein
MLDRNLKQVFKPENAYYVYIADEEEQTIFNEYNRAMGTQRSVQSTGSFRLDEELNIYSHIETEIAQLERIIGILEDLQPAS